jgi:hypothetical protein
MLLSACFVLVSCLAYSSTLKMEAIPLDFQQTAWWYILEDKTFHILFLSAFPIMSLLHEIV